MIIRVWGVFFALILTTTLCLAMDQVETKVKPNEDTKVLLERRIAEYWAARQVRDVRTLYDMESGSLPGRGLTPDRAMDLVGLRVRNVKTEVISIDSDRAKVRVKGEVVIGTFGWAPQTLEEQWVLIDGQWYHETKL